MPRSWLRTLMPVLLLAGVAAGGQPHHPGDTGRPVPPAPVYTPQDLQFLQHMIVHHRQALDMSELVPERTEREELARFARYVARAQSAEIAIMQSLLGIAAERGIEARPHPMHDDPPMPGMLSSAQIETLARARGEAFDRLWLEGMIYHHFGAIDMASEQQQRQLAEQRRPYGIDVLVEDILIEQRAEIATMRAWLREWGLASEDADAR